MKRKPDEILNSNVLILILIFKKRSNIYVTSNFINLFPF